jgi:hypothetical protein
MHRRTDDLPKALKREIRDLGGVLHERLLAAELAKLDAEFARWRAGELDAIDLSTLIHRFHEGPPRKLWIQFNTNDVGDLGWYLSKALADGTMRVDEFSVEALDFLGRK